MAPVALQVLDMLLLAVEIVRLHFLLEKEEQFFDMVVVVVVMVQTVVEKVELVVVDQELQIPVKVLMDIIPELPHHF